MFDFQEVPNHPTFGSRVGQSDFVCVQSRRTLSCSCVHVHHLDELCHIEMEGLCPNDHHGALKLWCLIQSIPPEEQSQEANCP